MIKPIDQYKPGLGWNHIGGAVWEHTNKTRIHIMGTIRLPDMTFVNLHDYPSYIEGHKYIAINGGNRKRGLMAWANNINLK